MQHDDLNTILGGRATPPKPREGFAESIIHAALMHPRTKAVSFWNELTTMFAIPHPSVVAAACVLFGLVIGIQASDGALLFQPDWSSFLDINEGGWL